MWSDGILYYKIPEGMEEKYEDGGDGSITTNVLNGGSRYKVGMLVFRDLRIV